MKNFLKSNSFIVAIVAAIFLAWIWPEAAIEGGVIPSSLLVAVGVFFIFFSQGVSLPFESLRDGFAEWRLHLSIQTTTFLVAPLLVGVGLWLSAPFFTDTDLRAGFLFLAILPTTITSAVALTASAGGNVSGALFNTTLSNVAGVFLVPLVCVFAFSTTASAAVPVSPLLLSVGLKILLPLLIGQCLRPWLKDLFAPRKHVIKRINNGVIYFIVYVAFCESFSRGIWGTMGAGPVIHTFLGVLILLGLLSGFVWWLGGMLKLSRGSRIAGYFCGSQKTLAAGLPLSAAIFGAFEGGPELSLLIVPILLYHPTQLVLGGWLVTRFTKGAKP